MHHGNDMMPMPPIPINPEIPPDDFPKLFQDGKMVLQVLPYFQLWKSVVIIMMIPYWGERTNSE